MLDLLQPDGPIGKKLAGFEQRDGQISMLKDVQAAYEEEKIALIEAGTGIGKSLAYLIPAIQWSLEEKEPTLIATHTIALQEQLIQKDIPFLIEALDLDLKVVLAKGMNNYVCLRKLHEGAGQLPDVLFAWAEKTQEGSSSSLPISPSPSLWEEVKAEAESCTHVKCPYYKACFFFKARKKAADAHLIVANHHLFFADLAIRYETGNYTEGCILPPYRRLILDEAHHIEEVATDHFADRVNYHALIRCLGRLTGKLTSLQKKLLKLSPEKKSDHALLELTLPSEKQLLGDLAHQLFDTIGHLPHEGEKLRVQEKHLQLPFWTNTLQPLAQTFVNQGKKFTQSLRLLKERIEHSECESVLVEISGLTNRLENIFNSLHSFIFSPLEQQRVRWIEGKAPHLSLVNAELEIAARLSDSLFQKIPTIVMCSATLAANRKFDFIRKRLGIEEAIERIYESPFDFEKQMILSVPTDLPNPNSPGFQEEIGEKIFEAIEISQGNAFVLFTSYDMLRDCEKRLADRFRTKKYPLLCQGEESRSALLRKFRITPRAVLFGADSFWEGVDVVGESLRCVIIVKLPFKVPSDPLFQARCEMIAKNGGAPFFDYSLPQAIIKFKQGFGRLIRNKNDRGCVICLDSRLANKGYGKRFLNSLPSCPHVFETKEKLAKKIRGFYSIVDSI
ncbi:MAG: helicase C-terminal domain-containing protein [Chlamydiales bacterium]